MREPAYHGRHRSSADPTHRRRRLGAVTATLGLTAAAFVTTTALGAAPAAAATGSPWDCSQHPYVFQSKTPPGQAGTSGLYVQQFTDTGSVFNPTRVDKNPNGYKYGELAFDPVDHYIYAYDANDNEILQVDAQGDLTQIGHPSPAPKGNGGTFDGQGNYYVGNGGKLYEATNAAIQAVAAGAPNPNATIPFTQLTVGGTVGNYGDFTWSRGDQQSGAGYLWGLEGDGTLDRIDLAALTGVQFAGSTTGIKPSAGDSYAAAWTFGNGNLGFDANGGDSPPPGGLGVQEVALATVNGASVDTPKLLHQISGPVANQNDGTACSGPADLAITKTVNGETTSAGNKASVAAGSAVTWKITLTDNGTSDSSEQFVTDTLPAGITNINVTAPNALSCTTATAGASFQCLYGTLPSGNSRAITITANAPAGAGAELDNTVTVQGNEQDPVAGNNTATAYATTPPAAIALTKSGVDLNTNSTSNAHVGDTVQYTFTVSNPSTYPLTGVAVNDPMVSPGGPVACPRTTLGVHGAPDGSDTMVCTATYTVTQANVDAGRFVNHATATGTAPGGSTVTSPEATAEIDSSTDAGITLTKAAAPTSGAVPGQSVHYTFSVQNTGQLSVQNPSIADAMAPGGVVACPAGVLGSLQTVTCSAYDHTVTQAEFDGGALLNNATATAAVVATGAPVTSQAQATVTMAAPTNSIVVTKTAAVSPAADQNAVQIGDTISYTVQITNDDSDPSVPNASMTGVTLTDALLNNQVACDAIPPAGIAPGQTLTCHSTAPYPVTQQDIDAGSVLNTVDATAAFFRGNSATGSSSALVQATAANPQITLQKSGAVTPPADQTGAKRGDTIDWNFVVTNSGNVGVTGVNLVDPQLGPNLACDPIPAGNLPPGGTLNCHGTVPHTVSQADVDTGSVENDASATATYTRGTNTDPALSSAIVSTEPAAPALSLTKTPTVTPAADQDAAQVGDTIAYGFVVTNTGNVTMTGVTISDPLIGDAVTCDPVPAGGLPPGAPLNCQSTASYTVTQGDVDAGTIVNNATAHGQFVRNGTATADATATTDAVAPANTVSLTKQATVTPAADQDAAQVGDTIAYSFVVTNTGNISLSGATIGDDRIGNAVQCDAAPAGGVPPGGTLDCSATAPYTVTQADFDAGQIVNNASVDAQFVRGADATAAAQATVTAAPAAPALGLAKMATVDPPADQDAARTGDSITYTFTVTNTGNVSVDTVTIADVDPDVGAVTCDPLPDGGGTSLAPQHSVDCAATAAHAITQAEFDDQAPLVNTATASAHPLRGTDPVTSDPATATVDLAAQQPGDSIAKVGTVTPAADQDAVKVGDTIQYTYTITNTGDVTMYDESVVDPHPGLGTITCPDTSAPDNGIPPGQSVVCSTATDGYTVTQADVDAGFVYNEATPGGTPKICCGDITHTPGDSTIHAEPAAPAVALVKSAAVSPAADQDAVRAKDSIQYSFEVTNTGNITVTDVAIDDEDASVGSITCPDLADPGLAPGNSTTCTADTPRVVTQAEFDAQQSLVNTATASAQPLRGPDPGAPTTLAFARPLAAPPLPPLPARIVSAPSTVTLTLAAPVSDMKVVKTGTVVPATDQKAFKLGDRINYAFVVTNTGNVTMSDITVDDSKLGAVTCPAVPAPGLAPGDTLTCHGAKPHVVTQADVDRGYYDNSAVVGGNPPPSTGLDHYKSPPGKSHLTAQKPHPGISLVKKAHVNPAGDTQHLKVGDTISYTFLVTNTGNVTLTHVGVTDRTGGTVTCPTTTLAPGQSETCRTVHPHTVTASDVSHGVVNKATAHGTPPQGLPPVTSSISTASVPAGQAPAAPQSTSSTLASTGSDLAGPLGAGVLALLGGLLLLVVAGVRRRRQE